MTNEYSRRHLLLRGSTALLLLGSVGHTAPAWGNGAGDVVTITTASGEELHFIVEIARTSAERSVGLMHRDRLDPDQGMLFVYEAEKIVTMWMRDTRIPLDMLFIGADGRIATIRERAVPFSEEVINSRKPIVAVLELNGGTVSRLDIKPGDAVLLPEGAR
ncbi:MAG: DUF192 domain-containing protein [Rhodospirillaceae bacterium]|nr:DUF192 domain-containing protein [Rhodospirillaceae bacterium]